jgi:ribosomal protein S18 acetylase RimI-like enzyme
MLTGPGALQEATVGVEIRPVHGRLGRHRFVDFPFRAFGDDPTWVPPLRISVYDRLSPKHPATAHQETELWLAYRDGRPVGRIGACIDRFFNEYQGVSWGWVGFFEALDDGDAASALFEVACDWAARRGAEMCVGPASFTTNDEIGLLVEGFKHPPLILTTHNPPYYEQLWVDAGWEQAMDLWGWRGERSSSVLSERQRRTLARLKERAKLSVRSMRMDDFDAEVGRFFEVYNAAWSRNWGFAPMPEAEIRHLGKSLKQILDPNLALVVEKPDGEPVAVSLTLPDVNEVMRNIRSGRLLPLGWLKLMRGLPKVTQARVFALGVKPEHQTLALGPLLYQEIFDRLRAKPTIQGAEASWILATNDRMNSAVEAMGAKHYKTWRLYQRPL